MKAGNPRRWMILEAAERLLRHYGPTKTTVADIAKEAHIGVGTVYLDFPSKDAILEALAEKRHAFVFEAMREAAEASSSPAERLQAVFEARTRLLLRFADDGIHARDLLHCSCSAIREVHTRFLDDERRLLAALLQEGVEQGLFVPCEPSSMARALQMALVSLSPPWLFSLPRHEVEPLLRDLLALFFRGLLSRGLIS